MQLKCPHCASDGPFSVQVYTMITLGTDDNGEIIASSLSDSDDVRWHDDSRATCEECDHTTKMIDVVNYAEKVIDKIHERLCSHGIKHSRAAVHGYFVGGGPSVCELMDELVRRGFNEGASSYQENYFFWEAMCVSQNDFNELVKAGN